MQQPSCYIVCLDDVASRMQANQLQLNAAKMEVIWCSLSRRQHQILVAPVLVGTAMITPVCTVRDLGIYVNSDVLMRSHIVKTVLSWFAVLRRICSIHWSVTRPLLQSLVVSLVLTRLDYSALSAQLLLVCHVRCSTDFSRSWTQPWDWFSLFGLLSRRLIVLLFCRCWCCVFIILIFCVVALKFFGTIRLVTLSQFHIALHYYWFIHYFGSLFFYCAKYSQKWFRGTGNSDCLIAELEQITPSPTEDATQGTKTL